MPANSLYKRAQLCIRHPAHGAKYHFCGCAGHTQFFFYYNWTYLPILNFCIISLVARFMGPHGAHLGPVGPRWATCRPHEPCYLWWYEFQWRYMIDCHGVGKHWHLACLFNSQLNTNAPHYWSSATVITGERWIPPHKGPVMQKVFPWHDIIMLGASHVTWWNVLFARLRWLSILFCRHGET